MKPHKQADYESYRRIKLLGEGSFGKAFLVECLHDNTQWVAKYMDMNAMSPAEREETCREAKILEFLQHPNIVRFREVYRTKKGKLCIIMEYAEGGDLSLKVKQAKTQKRNFDENQILDWFTQICLALKHVHDRKIIHRDLKGSNIFLNSENIVKLGDFGIARTLRKTLEKAKTMVGTPYYISPEIINGKPYTFQTDVWSLGVILYELCALEPPFNADSLHFLALKIVKGQYTPIPSMYSSQMRNLVSSLLCTEQKRRPTINEILKTPLIQNRIKGFLSETIRKQEFSHTVLHNRVFDPKMDLNNINLIANEAPCPKDLLEKNKRDLAEFPQIGKADPKPQDKKPEIKSSEPKQSENQDLMRPPILGNQKPAAQPVQKGPEQKPVKVEQVKKLEPLVSKDSPQQNKKQVEPQKVPPQAQPQSKLPVPPSAKQPEQQVKRVHANSDQIPKAEPQVEVGKAPSAQNFASPKILGKLPESRSKGEQFLPKEQNSREQFQARPPTAPKESNKAPAPPPQACQRPQSSRPQAVEKGKVQKIVVEKKRPTSMDKNEKMVQAPVLIKQPSSQQNSKEQLDKQRQEERIRLIKQQREEQEKQKEKEKEQEKEKARILAQRASEQKAKEQAQKEELGRKELLQKQEQQKKQPERQALQKQPSQGAGSPLQQKKQDLDKVEQKDKQLKVIAKNHQELDQLIKELELLVSGANSAVDKLQAQANGKENIFDNPSVVNYQIDDRDDDDDDDEEIPRQAQQRQQPVLISKQDEELFDCISQKPSTLKFDLEKRLGAEVFEKARAILEKELKSKDLEQVERENKRSKYANLLPFLTEEQRFYSVPLIITYITLKD